MFRLRFHESQIAYWAERNRYPLDGVMRIAQAARARGYLKRDEFLKLCRWKTSRSARLCRRNRESLVREVTRRAFATRDEELKIRELLSLSGVGWPTASVILHFCDRAPYPLLDYRAIWSLGIAKPPSYTFRFWIKYTRFMRNLADRTQLDLRTLDRALWQYSRERQRSQTQ